MLADDPPSGDQLNARVRQLLAGMAAHGDRHLAEVERDLVQMDALLDEAIKKLCASFMAIHHAVEAQQQDLNAFQAHTLSLPDYAARVVSQRDEVARHVGDAVTGLQFQDMTSQLIGRMIQHLAGLREVFGALDTQGTVLPESGDRALLAMLDHISERVGMHCAALSVASRSTVNQRHMNSGDIELF